MIEVTRIFYGNKQTDRYPEAVRHAVSDAGRLHIIDKTQKEIAVYNTNEWIFVTNAV